MIEYYKWYKRYIYASDGPQYFILTPLKGQVGKQDHKFSFILDSKTDDITKITGVSFGAFSIKDLEQGSKFNKAGNYIELDSFLQGPAYEQLGMMLGKQIIQKIFEHY